MRQPTKILTAAGAAVVLALTGACMNDNGSEEAIEPPERDFDQSTSWEQLEAAAAESIEGLPDFPGFETRSILLDACSYQGEGLTDYVNVELSYQFSVEDSATALVRETYTGLFRESWTDAGYDIHRDESRGSDPVHYTIEALRPDGINYWYTAANLVTLTIQSGCIKRVDDWVPECPEPLGSVTAENDYAAQKYCTAEDSSTEEADAVAPFEGGHAAAPLGTIPWQNRTPGESGNQL